VEKLGLPTILETIEHLAGAVLEKGRTLSIATLLMALVPFAIGPTQSTTSRVSTSGVNSTVDRRIAAI
jgi:hypothetical protein